MVAMVTVSVCLGLPETTEQPVVAPSQTDLMICLMECNSFHNQCLDNCEKLLKTQPDKPTIARECNCMRRLRKCTKACHMFYPKPKWQVSSDVPTVSPELTSVIRYIAASSMYLQWSVSPTLSPNVLVLSPDASTVESVTKCIHTFTRCTQCHWCTQCDMCHQMYIVSLHINNIVTTCTHCVNRSGEPAVTSVTRSIHVIKCTHCVTRFTCSDMCHQMYLHCQMSSHHRNPYLQVLADVCSVTFVTRWICSNNCQYMS